MYQKELQNNLRSNGSTPSPPPGLSRAAGNIPRVRTVVGAPPPVEKESKAAAKNRKKREAKKQAQEKNNSPAPEATTSASPVPAQVQAQAQAPASTPAPAPATAGVIGGVASLEEKKIRSLLKKLRAIEQLKMKQASGETLEDTQVIKISKEDEIRSELQTLGWNE